MGGIYSRLMALISVTAVAVGALLAAPDPAAAQEAPIAVVVFDNSGSMWGKLEPDKPTKLILSRDAVYAALERLAGKTRTGLVTFGRRRGDCGDVEVVVRPDAVEPERFRDSLDKLNPKGRGPIVLAVREAAKAIAGTRPASVVLIHDDLDNCQQDACQLGTELRQSHPGLRVNIVSLGMKKEDLPRIACLAEATGGRHMDAQGAVQVASFIGQALAPGGEPVLHAAQPSRPPPSPMPAARPAAEMVPKDRPAPPRRPSPPPTEGPAGLWLAAVLGADGPLVDGAVSWRVLRKEGAVETSAFEAQSSEARATLPPGSYTVETTYGLVRKRSTFDVAPGRPTPAIVALDAGGLRFLARAQAGGPTIDQVTYTAYPAEPAAGEPLWIGTDPPSPLGLAPGAYRVVAERGFARSERMVTVAAGAAGDADMTLGAGLLTLKVAAREDGEALPGAVFIVAADDPGHLQGRRELVRSAATEPDFVLPAGSYTVTTRIGDSEARDRIALGAGESVRRTIILGLGRLALSARIEPVAGQAPLREQISFRVMRRDGDAREVARAVSSPQTIELPAGSYRIEAVAGSHNARTVRDVDLQVGRTLQLAMDVPAARLTLKLAEDMGRGEPTWEVRDESNRVVARSNQVEPQLMLAPGRYTIRAAVRDRRGEEEVTLRLGESRTIEVERD